MSFELPREMFQISFFFTICCMSCWNVGREKCPEWTQFGFSHETWMKWIHLYGKYEILTFKPEGTTLSALRICLLKIQITFKTHLNKVWLNFQSENFLVPSSPLCDLPLKANFWNRIDFHSRILHSWTNFQFSVLSLTRQNGTHIFDNWQHFCRRQVLNSIHREKNRGWKRVNKYQFQFKQKRSETRFSLNKWCEWH